MGSCSIAGRKTFPEIQPNPPLARDIPEEMVRMGLFSKSKNLGLIRQEVPWGRSMGNSWKYFPTATENHLYPLHTPPLPLFTPTLEEEEGRSATWIFTNQVGKNLSGPGPFITLVVTRVNGPWSFPSKCSLSGHFLHISVMDEEEKSLYDEPAQLFNKADSNNFGKSPGEMEE